MDDMRETDKRTFRWSLWRSTKVKDSSERQFECNCGRGGLGQSFVLRRNLSGAGKFYANGNDLLEMMDRKAVLVPLGEKFWA